MRHMRNTIALMAMIIIPGLTTAQANTSTPRKKGYVAANGVNYYYEIHGRGEPMLLLHGGLGSIDMFGPVLPTFAKERQVIAIDLHGHGRTGLGERKIDLIDIGNDLAVVVRELGYRQVDALGYSFGSGAAFRLAVQHPALVRRLVLVSGCYTPDCFHPEMRPMQAQVGAAMADAMKETPMYQSYVKVAPRPGDFPRLLDHMGALMREHYDWSEDAKALRMPVMLVYGDADMYQPEYVVKFYKLLGGGLKDAGWMREHMSQNRLAILPDLTHYEMFMSPLLATISLPFLNGKSNAPSWAQQTKQEN
jgi:pimeloyl-ACP methyl ester carboxylesterase